MSLLFQILASFITGLLLGAIYTILKLPLPAPTAFAGIIGIVGVYAGYVCVTYFLNKI